MNATEGSMTAEFATRVASAIAATPGIDGAVIASKDGDVLGVAALDTAQREATLAAFLPSARWPSRAMLTSEEWVGWLRGVLSNRFPHHG